MIRNIFYHLFALYKKYFLVERGKARVADFLTKIFGTFVIKSRYSFLLEIYVNSSQDMFLIDLVDDLIIKEVKKLKEGNVFIDIGANIGFYSMVASEFVGENGKIICIEPSHREYIRILNNINSNKIKNVISLNFIISNVNDIIPFTIADKHTGLNKINTGINNDNILKLPSFTLDSITNLLHINSIDLLKIDVEGAEMLIINGMRNLLEKKMVNKIILEITPRFLSQYGHDKELVYRTLQEYGYKPRINSSEWQYDEIFELN